MSNKNNIKQYRLNNISGKEKVLDILSPKINLKAEIENLPNKINKISNNINDAKNIEPSEIAIGNKFSDISKYANIAYSELKKELTKNFKGEDNTQANEYGTWEKVSSNSNLYKNLQEPPKSSKRINDKEKTRIVLVCNGYQLRKILRNKNYFSKNFETIVSKFRGYSTQTENGNIDAYKTVGMKKIPVELKAYFMDTNNTILGSLNTLKGNNLSKYISEEWRYWIYNKVSGKIVNPKINRQNDTQNFVIIFYPIFTTIKDNLLSNENEILDNKYIKKLTLLKGENFILNKSLVEYRTNYPDNYKKNTHSIKRIWEKEIVNLLKSDNEKDILSKIREIISYDISKIDKNFSKILLKNLKNIAELSYKNKDKADYNYNTNTISAKKINY